jgi:DNA-directed RNA polymerase subunit F
MQKKESSKSSVKKKLTKVAEAKKVMKRNFKVNKKITFTDEGEVRFCKHFISENSLGIKKVDSAADR